MPKTESKTADQTLTPTDISSWGKSDTQRTDEGVILELPSGNVCRIRRTMDLLTMLRSGKIPNPLAGVVNKMIEGDGSLQGAIQSADAEATSQLIDLMDQQMTKSFMEPKVSAPPPRNEGEPWDSYAERVADWVPDEGTLSVLEISMEDKVYVMAVAQGGPANLERFRAEQDAALDPVPASKPVVKATKRTGGAKSKK